MATTTRLPLQTFSFGQSMTLMDCAFCGLVFAVTADYEERRREDHKDFYCPAGHANVFSGPTRADRERRKREAAERDAANAREDARIARAHARQSDETAARERRRASALKGHATRLRRRAGKGKCPDCSEEFPNLRDHVREAHPELVT